MTMPPPTPVPRIAEHRFRIAPGTVDGFRQRKTDLASLARRTRAGAGLRSVTQRWPIRQVELAFAIRPLRGDSAPGIPMPTLVTASSASRSQPDRRWRSASPIVALVWRCAPPTALVVWASPMISILVPPSVNTQAHQTRTANTADVAVGGGRGALCH